MTYFIQGDNTRPTLIICLSFTKLLTFPLLVLDIASFNLSGSNNPHKIFLSKVISK